MDWTQRRKEKRNYTQTSRNADSACLGIYKKFHSNILCAAFLEIKFFILSPPPLRLRAFASLRPIYLLIRHGGG